MRLPNGYTFLLIFTLALSFLENLGKFVHVLNEICDVFYRLFALPCLLNVDTDSQESKAGAQRTERGIVHSGKAKGNKQHFQKLKKKRSVLLQCYGKKSRMEENIQRTRK